jgi:hypothetical protein
VLPLPGDARLLAKRDRVVLDQGKARLAAEDVPLPLGPEKAVLLAAFLLSVERVREVFLDEVVGEDEWSGGRLSTGLVACRIGLKSL